jgi:hypothetical protein
MWNARVEVRMASHKSKGRGGSRPGAGRKPVLRDELERWAVGGWCESEWRRIAEENARERVENQKLPAALDELRNRILQKAENLNWPRDRIVNELISAGERTFGKRSRLYRCPRKRPYGERDKVIHSAIAHFKQRCELTLTRRTVEQCWKDFLALERYVRRTLPLV